MFIKVIDSDNYIYPYDLQELRNQYKHVLLPEKIPTDILAKNDVHEVNIQMEPYHNKDTHYVVRQSFPQKVDNSWVLGYDVFEFTEEDIINKKKTKELEIREMRNQLLLESDWTQLKDVPQEISNEWSVYRQQLRDITLQPSFPETVEWPVSPKDKSR